MFMVWGKKSFMTTPRMGEYDHRAIRCQGRLVTTIIFLYNGPAFLPMIEKFT